MVKMFLDLVGDHYSFTSNPIQVPDNDPLDNCSSDSHGTHVAGIVAANATGISQTGYIPAVPFLGVAPQATLGACNDGAQGVQTGITPAISLGAIAVASVDSSQSVGYYIIAPDGKTISYIPGTAFGGWQSITNSTIVVNDPQATVNDGCNGLAKSVVGVVVLFKRNIEDTCGTVLRCDTAAAAGATGCLVYNSLPGTGSSSIPSGIITLDDGQLIVAIIAGNPSAVFTFTNIIAIPSIATGGTPSFFTSLGPTGDLLFKPQISGIGGYVYSTISSFAATKQKQPNAYAVYSGTSMATPYVAGYE
ncbi:unnamed protein product [Rotaria sp. Silwood1]|nr:unnamed protein product [Rotaria sp. Silwood1]CAF1359739.1 unnamed protein product [Rotaria sp. Silwood1]